MNRLVWKLLRRHISGAQLAGFFLASLFGMSIVLLGIDREGLKLCLAYAEPL